MKPLTPTAYLRLNAFLGLFNLGLTVVWLLRGSPLAAGISLTAGVICTTSALMQWRKNHGRNRKAEASPQDPYTSARNRAVASLTTGGPWHAHTFTWTAPSERARPDLSLEVVESDVPILAQRAARLVFNGDSKPWASLHKDASFGVDAEAECVQGPYAFARAGYSHIHEAPSTACQCGFYSVPCDIEPWAESGEYVTLIVELSGTIIEHEKGYRAGHQRVMECRLPSCRFCGDVAEIIDVRDNVMSSACCATHVPKADGQVLVTVDDLAKLLPVPVTTAGVSTVFFHFGSPPDYHEYCSHFEDCGLTRSECWVDSTSLNTEGGYDVLVERGPEAVWSWLAESYLPEVVR